MSKRREAERAQRLEREHKEHERMLYRIGNDFEDHVITMFDPSKFELIHRTPTNEETGGGGSSTT